MQNSYNQEISLPKAQSDAATIFLAKVFNWMAIGLGLTGITAFVTAFSGLAPMIIGSPIFFVLIIAELGVVFYLSARVEKLAASTAAGLFIGYSILNGLTLSVLFLAYTMTSLASTFFITAAMFGSMAVYGFVTKKDLSSWGSFLFMGLIGIIIASLVNMFMHSPMISWVVSAVGVIIFTGLTAYDVQKIMKFGASGIMGGDVAVVRKGAIMGALTLYLDFINLFIMLLHFLGNRR